MGIFDRARESIRIGKLKAAELRRLEELLHEVVDEEMQAGEIRRGLWTKALAESDGDEIRAKGKYISLRVQSLTDEMLVMSDALAAANAALQKYRPVAPPKPRVPLDPNFGRALEVDDSRLAEWNKQNSVKTHPIAKVITVLTFLFLILYGLTNEFGTP